MLANLGEMEVLFLSTLPARGATGRYATMWEWVEISIHAPREGSDILNQAMGTATGKFLSTLPARGATLHPFAVPADRRYFYPRSPRGERLFHRALSCDLWHFYPRSPRGERQQRQTDCKTANGFLSTLPARGATC